MHFLNERSARASATSRHASALKARASAAEDAGMDLSQIGTDGCLHDHRGGRRHRFMESADINAAFREMFRPLRANIRRGMTIECQVYAFELDACVPGQLLGGCWIPSAALGFAAVQVLADPGRRRTLFARLLAEQRAEALFAYVSEVATASKPAMLYVELVSADGCYAAEHPLRPGRGWYVRDLVQAPAYRLGPNALA